MPVDETDLDWNKTDRDDACFRRKKLAAADGGDALGASLYELPPGERSWPYHFHTGNEEALYVLAGKGTLRLADEAHELSPGVYAAIPADESGAHRVVNDSDTTLRYLMISTMRDPDVTVYPNRNRVGVFAGAAPGGEDERVVSGYWDRDADVDYWE